MTTQSQVGSGYRLHGKLEVVALTDPGNVRPANEDSFLVDPTLGLILVADGMSGHGGGAVASAVAVTSCHDYLSRADGAKLAPAKSDETVLDDQTMQDGESLRVTQALTPAAKAAAAVAFANSQIYAHNRANGMPDRKGIGTTLAGLYWPNPADPRAMLFHVGDCRVYRLRDGVLRHLTHDHSGFQRWIDQGLRGPQPARNVVLRAVGPTPTVEADVMTTVLLAGDVILLCSDGLTTMVADDDIKAVMRSVAAGAAVADEALRLITMAKANGGKDNVTVALGRAADL